MYSTPDPPAPWACRQDAQPQDTHGAYIAALRRDLSNGGSTALPLASHSGADASELETSSGSWASASEAGRRYHGSEGYIEAAYPNQQGGGQQSADYVSVASSHGRASQSSMQSSHPNSQEAYIEYVGGALSVVRGRKDAPWPPPSASSGSGIPGEPMTLTPNANAVGSSLSFSIGNLEHDGGNCRPCKFHNLTAGNPCYKGSMCDRCHDPSHADGMRQRRIRRGGAKRHQNQNANSGTQASGSVKGSVPSSNMSDGRSQSSYSSYASSYSSAQYSAATARPAPSADPSITYVSDESGRQLQLFSL
eukprot:TRINITY_DN112949_c0_g1_i1.p1 TRINITY_DN112949_c0_g1~~TRINITY_DN112949_c0_g1_i1.p1  ORF type:complete len:306 (-),score=19.70 TRINITY_DN112949_c0_g1_i1:147-1064(-)